MKGMRVGIVAVALAGAWVALAPAEAQGQRRERDRISREEILASAHRDQDLHRAIRGLRPRFLEGPRGVRTLGGTTPPAPIAVFVDGKRQGGPDILLSIMASTVQEVRYMDPTRAENQYGQIAGGGAILITLYTPPTSGTEPPPAVPPPPGEGRSRP